MPEDPGGEPTPPDPAARSPAARSPAARSREPLLPDSLFPRALPVLPRLRVSACRRPAAGGPETEGDWLDVLALPGGVIALVLARADGPGGLIGAAAVRLRASLRELLRGGAAPAEALAGLAAAAAGSPAVHRATACVALLTPETGDLRSAVLGQPRPVVCTAAGTNGHLARPASEAPGPGSPGPGAGHREAGTTVLPSGAVLLLYYGPAAVPSGDGLLAGDGRPGGDGPPGTAARAAATASSLLADPALGGAADLADRVVPEVLAALTPGRGAGPAAVLAAYRLQTPAGGWSMDLPADPLALRGLRARLRDWLRELGASASDRTDVELAVWEVAVNAIVHGRPATGPGSITVRTVLDDSGRAVIQVSDRGRWRPPQPPDTGRRWPGGQGLLVIRQAADELDIAPGPEGTTVTLRRSLSHPLPGQAQPAEYPATAARQGRLS